jgi:hypothetical protein
MRLRSRGCKMVLPHQNAWLKNAAKTGGRYRLRVGAANHEERIYAVESDGLHRNLSSAGP